MRKKIVILFSSLVVLFFSCTNQETDNTTFVSDSLTTDTLKNALPYFYKHMKGTIGNLNITMDIAYDGTSYTGTYYYDKKVRPISLTGMVDSTSKTIITEDVNGVITGTFGGEFSDSMFKGNWISADKKTSLPFELKENYTNAIRFDAYLRADSVVLFDTIKNSPSAKMTQFFLVPSSGNGIDSSFQNKVLKASIGKAQALNDIKTIMEKEAKTYEKDYLENKENFSTGYESYYAYNWENSTKSGVIYNENGILSVASLFYEYTGGAHGNYGESFTVFNIATGDTVGIKDLFLPGFEERLSTLIEQKIKSDYKISKNGSLEESGFLVEDGIKYTDNFYLTKSGIGFLYNPYEIAAYSLGQISVFIPYNELKSILKKDGIINKIL